MPVPVIPLPKFSILPTRVEALHIPGKVFNLGLCTSIKLPSPSRLPNLFPPTPHLDLGKSARDLFGKGFNYGAVKVEMKTLTSSGVNFTTGGNSKLDSGKLGASLEAKVDIKV